MIIKVYVDNKYVKIPAKVFAQSARKNGVSRRDFVSNVMAWAALSVSDAVTTRAWIAECKKEFAKGRPPRRYNK